MRGRFGLWYWCKNCKTDEYIGTVWHSKSGYNYYCSKCGAKINGMRLTEKRLRADIIEYIRKYGAGSDGNGVLPQDISLELGIPFEDVMRVTRELIDEGIIEAEDCDCDYDCDGTD